MEIAISYLSILRMIPTYNNISIITNVHIVARITGRFIHDWFDFLRNSLRGVTTTFTVLRSCGIRGS